MEFTDYGENYNELGFLLNKTIKGAVWSFTSLKPNYSKKKSSLSSLLPT